MDVLNAELKWINYKCYRLLRIRDNTSNEEEEEELRSSNLIQEVDEYDSDLPILHQGNEFYITIHVPFQLIGHIVGSFGRMRKLLEQYGAKVKVPQQNNTGGITTITGSTKKIVSDAYHRIENIVITQRLKKEASHFISLPMNSAEIKESFLKFKTEVLNKYKMARGVNENIFQNHNKLHVTITPLILLDERDNQSAISILQNSMNNILENIGVKELVLHVKGIEYMNDDPAEVDVLYAKLKELDEDNRLQIIADSLMKEFVKQNLAKSQHEKVKLHITVMNTLFRDDQQDENSRRITFDARGILKDFGDYDFGKIVLSEIHISVRHTTSIPDNYYIATHKVKLSKI